MRKPLPEHTLSLAYDEAVSMTVELYRTTNTLEKDAAQTQLKADALPNHPDAMPEYRRLYSMLSDSSEVRAAMYEARIALNKIQSLTAKYKKR